MTSSVVPPRRLGFSRGSPTGGYVYSEGMPPPHGLLGYQDRLRTPTVQNMIQELYVTIREVSFFLQGANCRLFVYIRYPEKDGEQFP